MQYNDIFKVLNFRQADREIKNLVKDFHSFCNCKFIEEFDEVLLSNKNGAISNAPHLWEALFIAKDNLRASEILFHLNFFEQSSSQLRIAYEKLGTTMAYIINCSVPKYPQKPQQGINIKETLKKLANNLKLSNEIYNLYKELSGPIHNPSVSHLDNSYEELPLDSSYNLNLCKKRLLKFINKCTELIIGFALYHSIKVDTKELMTFGELIPKSMISRLKGL